jgi:G8 domain
LFAFASNVIDNNHAQALYLNSVLGTKVVRLAKTFGYLSLSVFLISCGSQAGDPTLETPTGSVSAVQASAVAGSSAISTNGSVTSTNASTTAGTNAGTPEAIAAIIASSVCSSVDKNSTVTALSPVNTAERWSNPAIWGGALPKEGSAVIIPVGRVIELDVDTPKLSSLVVAGKLIAAKRKSVSITADSIMVHGLGASLSAGTPTEPYNGNFNIMLSGKDPSKVHPIHGAKVLATMEGGELALYGERKLSYSRLNTTAAQSSLTIELIDTPLGWPVGDEISIAPTDFDALQAEKRRIVSVRGKVITLDQPLTHAHYGGASEKHGNLVLDMRAHVGNLSRNIKISSIENQEISLPGFNPDSYDAAGLQNGAGKRIGNGRFGGHLMFMEKSSAKLDSVEVTQMGQQGVLGRYPVHWHLTRDSSRENNFIRFSSVHSTFQRGVVLHQAYGVEVEDNVIFDILGHGVYLEDGIEHDNSISRNLVKLIRYVPRMHRLSVKDPEKDRAEKLSAFWITNPANTFRDNIASGVQNGWGFIFANVQEDKVPVILPSEKNWVANRSYIGFSNNIAYAIGFLPGVPDGGDSVFNLGYGPEEAGSCFRFNFGGDVSKSVAIDGLTAFKCANAASWSTNFLPIKRAVVADSRVAIVNNQGEGGASGFVDSAVIGMTANNPSSRLNLNFGPFVGPGLKESLEAGPVALNNVVTSYRLFEQFDGLAPAMQSSRSDTQGFKVNLPTMVAIKANDSVNLSLSVDRSGGYLGTVDVSLDVPKPPNLATENPYFFLTSPSISLGSSITTGSMTFTNGAADRAGDSLVVMRAKGDATVLNTLRVLTATQ